MPANLTYHIPIGSVQTDSGNTPLTRAVAEQAGQTFKVGVPVQLNAGFIRQWDGTTITSGIAGFSLTPGANLPTNGKGAPGGFGQVGAPGTTLTYGYVPFTAAGLNIPVGAPMSDGRTLFESAIGDVIYEAVFDNSAGAVAADYTPPVNVLGLSYGLTADANGMFYIDGAKTTVGTNTVVQIVGVNPIDLTATGGNSVNMRLRFKVATTARQLI